MEREVRWPVRVLSALALLGLVIFFGAAAISASSSGQYSLLEAAYFAVITVSTVGYSECRTWLPTRPCAR